MSLRRAIASSIRPDRSIDQHVVGSLDTQSFAQQRSQPFLVKYFRMVVGLSHHALQRIEFRAFLPVATFHKFLEIYCVFSAALFDHGVHFLSVSGNLPYKIERSKLSGRQKASHRWLAFPLRRDAMRKVLRSDEQRAPLPVHQQQRIAAAFLDRALELRDVLHRLVIDFLNDVALLQA
jgi:hypothetical protein